MLHILHGSGKSPIKPFQTIQLTPSFADIKKCTTHKSPLPIDPLIRRQCTALRPRPRHATHHRPRLYMHPRVNHALSPPAGCGATQHPTVPRPKAAPHGALRAPPCALLTAAALAARRGHEGQPCRTFTTTCHRPTAFRPTTCQPAANRAARLPQAFTTGLAQAFPTGLRHRPLPQPDDLPPRAAHAQPHAQVENGQDEAELQPVALAHVAGAEVRRGGANAVGGEAAHQVGHLSQRQRRHHGRRATGGGHRQEGGVHGADVRGACGAGQIVGQQGLLSVLYVKS